MAEFKFACPQCGQFIQCDERWSGQQLPCPACRTIMIVPQLALPEPPAAPLPAAPRPQPRPAAPRASQPPRFTPKKIALIACGVLAFGVFYYFGLGWADSFQNTLTRNRKNGSPSPAAANWVTSPTFMLCLTKPDPEHMMGRNFDHPALDAPRRRHELRESFAPPPNPAENGYRSSRPNGL